MAPISPAVAERAAEWLVELQSDEADAATQQGLQQWLAQNPEHQRAWQHIASITAQWRSALGASAVTGQVASQVAQGALMAAPQRRNTIKALTLLLATGSSAWLAHEHMPWREWRADERTSIGQRRQLTLDDHSTLTLNTDSAIDVRFTRAERRVRLLAGEILISTGEDQRPFIVETAHGELQPLGTRFAVRQHADSSRVDVFEGAVAIRPRSAPAALRVLRAGEHASFSDSAVGTPHAVNQDSIAWSEGMLVAGGMRLDDFLAELGRYRRGRLGCDPAIAGLHVSGSYPLDDSDRILDTLPTTLPVEVAFVTRYWVTVRPARR